MGIFLLALFLRAYFGLGTATENGFLLSGGSDSYYHKRIIDYAVATGRQPYLDRMLNYPIGLYSVRPPLYDWSVAVTGIVLSPLFGSVDVSVWYSFLFSTAMWGALTVFPTYFMTKEAFDKRIGLLAAFFLAVMPAHIQRSPLTNGDHDSYALFFAVLSFQFFLKALKALRESEWITNWRRPRVLFGDLRKSILDNQKALLYSAMAGTSIGAIALAWSGFSYVVVILLIFYIVQILINRLKNRDSVGLIACFAVTIGFALLISFPFYSLYHYIEGWLDTPFYMLLIAIAFGGLFQLTRKYPWMLVIPMLFAVFIIGLLILSVIYPTTVQMFFSGFGYFIRSKLYTTIAEAQPPNFSNIVLSFGAVTFYLSMFGLVWSVVQIPKRLKTDYIFIVVWIALSIYMAIAAARFIFNGAPAFAMTAAWIAIFAMDKLDIRGARKTYRSISGNRFQALKRSVKVRHVAAVLMAAVLLILPNVWFGVDASIPFEDKSTYDTNVYNSIPSFMRPSDFGQGGLWYLGAFGYSLPLNNRYWPKAYDWLEEQDKEVPVSWERPAIVSWWDYGFEFVQEGKHPTVADNFQSGYQIAGNFIMSQSEKEAIALLTVRVVEGHYLRLNEATGQAAKNFGDDVKEVFSSHGMDTSVFEDAFKNPGNYVAVVKSNPGRFGPRSQDLSEPNAMYTYLRTFLTERLTTEELVRFYHDLRDITGKSIRYFAVDTRMFPFSAQVTGIFYAPATLSDHRIERGVPIDFYEIKAVSEFGTEYSADEVPPGTRITDYKIVYKDMFFNSTFYRTYVGYTGTEAGLGEGIPGVTENLAQQQLMPAWNMSHFRLAYRTAYYNPWPPAEVQNHSDEWTAVNFEDALELQKEIQDGKANGSVDASAASSLKAGVVVIKYFDGAIVNGTITIDGKTPFSGVAVTVQDEFGIPHGWTTSDSQGRYSIIVPPGNGIKLSASIGKLNNITKVGSTVLASMEFNVTDEQAMRLPYDRDGSGMYDYLIEGDIEIKGGTLKGKAFVDILNDGSFSVGDLPVSGATVRAQHTSVDLSLESSTNLTGDYELSGVYPGSYRISLNTPDRTFEGFSALVNTSESTNIELNVTSHSLRGVVSSGNKIINATVHLFDELKDTTIAVENNASSGAYEFRGLPYGNYTVRAESGDLSNIPVHVSIPKNESNQAADLGLVPCGRITVTTSLPDGVAPYATVKLERDDRLISEIVVSDSNGHISAVLPEGHYYVYSSYYSNGDEFAFLGQLEIERGTTTDISVNYEPGFKLKGLAYLGSMSNAQRNITVVMESSDGNLVHKAVTNSLGQYSVLLPGNTYQVKVSTGLHFAGDVVLNGDLVYNIPLKEGEVVSGFVYNDVSEDAIYNMGEGLEGAKVVFTDGSLRRFEAITDANGSYSVALDSSSSYTVSVVMESFLPHVAGPIKATELALYKDISLVPANITVSGRVIYNDGPMPVQVDVTFLRVSAMGELPAAIINTNYEYSASLFPGAYRISVDRELQPGERFQNLDKSIFSLYVGDGQITKDISVVRKLLLNGTISLEGVDPSQINNVQLDFTGPETTGQLSASTFGLYLTEGDYTVRANFSYQGAKYLNMSSLNLTSAMDISIRLENTTTVSGDLLHQGRRLGESAEITFTKSSGGQVRINSTQLGTFELPLIAGDYTVEVDHRTSEAAGEAVRFVRYRSSTILSVPQGMGTMDFDIILAKTLDNSTITGKVYDSLGSTVSATLELTGADNSAIDAILQSGNNGDYALSVHPGNYTIYGVRGDDVYLGTLGVSLGETRIMDLNLVHGRRLEGSLYIGSIKAEGDMTFILVGSNATISRSSEPSGDFAIVLVNGTYNVTASAQGSERGKAVTYSNTTEIVLETDRIVSIPMTKVKVYDFELYWNPVQKKKVGGNETFTYTIQLNNTGNAEDSYMLQGGPFDWKFEFTPATVSANFGDSDNTVLIDVRITSPEFPLASTRDLQVDAQSRNSSAASAHLSLAVSVDEMRGVELTIGNDTPTLNGIRSEYKFDVMNKGNANDNYTIMVVNKDELRLKGWQARFNQSGNLTESANVSVSPNTKVTIGLSLEMGSEPAEIMLLAFSDSDRGADGLLVVYASMPVAAIEPQDVDVKGEGFAMTPPDNLVPNLMIIMVIVTIVSVAAIIVLRRKKK